MSSSKKSEALSSGEILWSFLFLLLLVLIVWLVSLPNTSTDGIHKMILKWAIYVLSGILALTFLSRLPRWVHPK